MKFNIITGPLEKQNVSCIITAIFNNNELSHTTKILDKISNNYISNTIKNLNNEIIDSLILYNIPNIYSNKIILINCKNKNNLSKSDYKKIINNSLQIIKKTNSQSALYLINNDCNIKNQNIFYNTKNLIININEEIYSFNKYKTENNNFILKNIIIYSTKHELNNIQKSIKYGIIISKSIKYTKDLSNHSINTFTSSYFSNEVHNLSKIFKNLSIKIIEKKEIKKLKINSILTLKKKNLKKSKIIILKYNNNITQKPIVIIDKGIIFNDNNILNKKRYNIHNINSILGIFIFILELKIKINIIGIIPSIENDLNNKKNKNYNIIKTMLGKTIEILNNEIKEKIILCDILTYSQKYNPMVIIDITFFNNTIIFLGKNYNALYSNNSKLANDLIIAGKMINDLCWKMPLQKKYNKNNNNLTDIKNTENTNENTLEFASLLSKFTKNTPWAHIDISGTITKIKNNNEEITGRPIKLLIQYIINLASTFK